MIPLPASDNKLGLLPPRHRPTKSALNITLPLQIDNYYTVPTLLQNAGHNDNLSPGKLSHNSRPLIDMRTVKSGMTRKTLNIKTECINHPGKEGTYKATLEGETTLYCTKCSMQLASQGFSVHKILGQDSTSRKRRTLSSNLPSVANPNMQNCPRFRQITSFLDTSQSLHQNLLLTSQKFTSLPEHYRNQQSIVEDFYNSIIDYVTELKSQNVNLLRKQSRRQCQRGRTVSMQISRNTKQLDAITQDITTNIQQILGVISEEKFKQCIGFYRQKMSGYRKRLDQQRKVLEGVTNYVQADCDQTYKQIVDDINVRLGIDQLVQKDKDKVIYNLDPRGKRLTHQPLQTAFRNLFSDSQVFPQQQPSSRGTI